MSYLESMLEREKLETQYDRGEFEMPVDEDGPWCHICTMSIHGMYYKIDDDVICPDCINDWLDQFVEETE